MTEPSAPFLSVKNLTVHYRQGHESFPAVRDVSFDLLKGNTIGFVGESGCGKSTLALALLGLLPEKESFIANGSIFLQGREITNLSKEDWRDIRGSVVSIVFQDPFSSLNPVFTVEFQLRECFAKGTEKHVDVLAHELLKKVQLDDTDRILKSYPHQLSGGQRQRVLIACALARQPKLLIADEPTTALDVTIQDEIVKLLKSLQEEFHMAMIFITHNMGLVKDVSTRLAVMYAGKIVEMGTTADVLKNPKHPYTQGLLRSLPTLAPKTGPLPVLEGQPPEPKALPSGCSFHPRCEKIMERCRVSDPLDRLVDGRDVKCHLY